MSTRTNATISPDRAAGDANPIAVTVPRRSSRAKRRQEEADTHDGNGGTGPAAAKVARLASSEEETEEETYDEAPDTTLTTEEIINLLKDLLTDDIDVIVRTLTEIGDIGDAWSTKGKNEDKIRMLGGHTTVFLVLNKHVDCLAIQEQGMRALGTLSMLMPTKQLLGDIGCVEVILARMEKYLDSFYVQLQGCLLIVMLIDRMKGNAERLEKSGGIAVVIAAMKAHRNNKCLQKFGCYVFSRMSRWEEYRPLIVDAGGASAIALAVEKYNEDTGLRKEAYKTMQILFKE
jgi:hypothetical protein